MHNATSPSTPKQEKSSLLVKDVLLEILEQARLNLEKDGSLIPTLFIRLHTGKEFIYGVQLPDDSVRKCLMLRSIGRKIQEEHGSIQEAILLVETWYVDAHEAPNAAHYPPSQHPCRQEAITIIGRSEDNTRSATVIQTFTRDERNAPVWTEPHVNIVKPGTKGAAAKGILDSLFEDSP
jgi:hypothetical protein